MTRTPSGRVCRSGFRNSLAAPRTYAAVSIQQRLHRPSTLVTPVVRGRRDRKAVQDGRGFPPMPAARLACNGGVPGTLTVFAVNG